MIFEKTVSSNILFLIHFYSYLDWVMYAPVLLRMYMFEFMYYIVLYFIAKTKKNIILWFLSKYLFNAQFVLCSGKRQHTFNQIWGLQPRPQRNLALFSPSSFVKKMRWGWD